MGQALLYALFLNTGDWVAVKRWNTSLLGYELLIISFFLLLRKYSRNSHNESVLVSITSEISLHYPWIKERRMSPLGY